MNSAFLHLTDLHLSPTIDADAMGDFKSPIISPRDRPTRYDYLKNTFSQLAGTLNQKGKSLDSIVISGDITLYNDENGFARLEELLGWLGDDKPRNDRILAVPGNHDIRRNTPHSSPERYELFLKYTRSKGYITPLIEGIDLDDQGNFGNSIDKHCLIAPDFRWAVIPINSSNYCGSWQPLKTVNDVAWNDIPAYVAARVGGDKGQILKELNSLRAKDVARVSMAQLVGIQRLVKEVKDLCGKHNRVPVLIGVLHHQLLPVSIFEEFKEFESITNLGQLRCAIRELGISVLLHGHKHVEFVYLDEIPKMLPAQDERTYPVIVVSGDSLMTHDITHGYTGRLLEIPGNTTATGLLMTKIPWAPVVSGLSLGPQTFLPFSDAKPSDCLDSSKITIIEGGTLDEVYERALARFSTTKSTIPNLVCRVGAALQPVRLPKTYPDISSVSDEAPDTWFEKLVDWWQRRNFQHLVPEEFFNHGHRIFSYRSENHDFAVDQIANAIKALKKPTSSRAVVTLLQPDLDKTGTERPFPSFCLIQFAIRRGETASYLEAIGYFRKQEIRYWWPVNLAEISRLQTDVFDRIKVRVSEQIGEFQLGPVVTIAAIAVVGNTVPKVLVPAVDFYLEVKRQDLWDMTYAACWTEMPNRIRYIDIWKDLLSQLVPDKHEDPGGVVVPISGIKYLIEITRSFVVHHPGEAENLIGQWESLLSLNEDHRRQMDNPPPNGGRGESAEEQHSKWRDSVIRTLNGISKIVGVCFGSEMPVFA